MTASGSRSLRGNVVLNLAGYGLPLVAALAAVPELMQRLGPERFGMLALAWTVVSVAGMLDLGVGRALTKLVAESVGRDSSGEAGRLVGTALALNVTLGLALMGALMALAPVVVERVLEVPSWLRPEAVVALRVLALAVPAVLLGNSLRGVLEAHQRFGRLTVVRTLYGLAVFLGPLAVSYASAHLAWVMAVLVAARLITLGWLVTLVRRTVPSPWGCHVSAVAGLLRLGGWMSVSSVIASGLLYVDRFVIGAVVSLEAVAAYAAPAEVMQRLAVAPAAVMGVAFPAFSQALAEDGRRARRLYRRSLLAVAALLALPAAVLGVFSRPLLTLWLGPDMAARSAPVASVLAVGILLHGLAQPSFALLQAAGRPDLPARLHLVEAPLYLGYLLWLTERFGIVGSAVAWTLRVTLSLTVLSFMARRVVLARCDQGRVAETEP